MRITEVEPLVAFAAAAPSAHNSQPWEWELDDDVLVIRRSIERTLGVGDPTTRQATISIGIFVEHLVVGSAAQRIAVHVDSVADRVSDLEHARLTLRGDSNHEDLATARRASAVPLRHTFRGMFEDEEVPSDWIREVASNAGAGTGVVSTVLSGEAKREVAALVGESTRTSLQLPAMVRELADFMVLPNSDSRRGMEVQDSDWLQHLDVESEARFAEEKFGLAPAVVVLSTEHDGPSAWLDVGRVASRILLDCANEGLSHCISAGPVEIPTAIDRVRALTAPGLRPQMIIRFGRAPRGPALSARRRYSAAALRAVSLS